MSTGRLRYVYSRGRRQPAGQNMTEAALEITAASWQAKLPLLGSLPASLALALAAYAEQPWFGYALVVDLDEHALTLSTVRTDKGQAQLIETRVYPHLGAHAWHARLLNALSDCCVLQSRRDPRDAPAAEQSLYDQIDGLLEAGYQGRHINLGIQTASWWAWTTAAPKSSSAKFTSPSSSNA